MVNLAFHAYSLEFLLGFVRRRMGGNCTIVARIRVTLAFRLFGWFEGRE